MQHNRLFKGNELTKTLGWYLIILVSTYCLQLDVLVLTNEPTYHLRIHVKKGDGVLLQLTKALDALDFEIVNANLTTISDRFINTIVMKVKYKFFMSLSHTWGCDGKNQYLHVVDNM